MTHPEENGAADAPCLRPPFGTAEWREMAHQMVDFIADYHSNLEQYPVRSQVQPGYLRPLLPASAPEHPESLEAVLQDVSDKILPGITHWQSPSFFAYFSSDQSYPAMVADMLSGAFNVIGFSWISSPAATELENICMDWMGQLLGLPDAFLHERSGGKGGGCIQGSASDAALVAMLGAKARALEGRPAEDALRLVAYCSDQAHSSIKKGTMIAGITHLRMLKATAASGFALRPETLEEAVRADLEAGLLPFFVNATIGTTSSCAVDPVAEIAAVAQRRGLWLHVDAAWAGTFAVLPEQRQRYFQGLELADSFDTNPHKGMLVNFDCSCFFFRDSMPIRKALTLTPEYLKAQGNDYDLKDLQVPLGRRFRALKLWFVLRMHGCEHIRRYMQNKLDQQAYFEQLLASDPRFEIAVGTVPRFCLTCFRLKGASEEQSAALLEAINSTGKAFLVHTALEGRHTLRMAVGCTRTERRHIDAAWQLIQAEASRLLASQAGAED